jgi:hypothetical protein
MSSESLQRMIRAVPFQPFALDLADGERIQVPHPEFIAHAPGNRTAHITLPGDDFRIIDLLLVVSISPSNPTGAGTIGMTPEPGR